MILHCLNAIFKSQNALNSKFSGSPPRTPLGNSPDPLAGGEGLAASGLGRRPFRPRTQPTPLVEI